MKKSDLICTINIKDSNGNVIGHKEVVKYDGLLAMAHDEGLKSITTELAQVPNEENGQLAIVQARVETRKGIFVGFGDASPQNVARHLTAHLIRMAETRAKARALRDAVNIGTVSLEEMVSDLDDEIEQSADQPGNGGNGNTHHHTHQNHHTNSSMTTAQRRFLFRLLAERGIEADEARETLHKALGVDSLDEASKYDASNLIDMIQKGQLPEAITAGEA